MHRRQVTRHLRADEVLTMAAAPVPNPNAAPSNAVVIKLRNRARREGRDFHVGWANDAPRARRSIANAPYCNLFNNVPPPGPAGAAGLPDCDDRPNHDVVGTTANPCSSFFNPGPPGPAPGVPPPGGLPAYAPPAALTAPTIHLYMRRACLSHPAGRHPVLRVCGYCRIHTGLEPWYQGVVNDLIARAPVLPAAGAPAPAVPPQPLADIVGPGGAVVNPAYRSFLTPLCSKCEILEKRKYWLRILARTLPHAVNGLTPGLLREAPNGFPHNTCTCFGWLEGPNGHWCCIECRYDRAMERHGE